jgi:hypothetical protein
MMVLWLDRAAMNTLVVKNLPDVRSYMHKVMIPGRRHMNRCNDLGFRKLPNV